MKKKIIIVLLIVVIFIFILFCFLFKLDKSENLKLNLSKNNFYYTSASQYEKVIKGISLNEYLNSANDKKENISLIFDIDLLKLEKNENLKTLDFESNKTITLNLKTLQIDGYYSYSDGFNYNLFIPFNYKIQDNQFYCDYANDNEIITCNQLKNSILKFLNEVNELFDNLKLKIDYFVE